MPGAKLGIVRLEGRDEEDVTLTDSFRDKASQNVIRVVELSKGPDDSITDSDEDMIGGQLFSPSAKIMVYQTEKMSVKWLIWLSTY